MAQVHVSNGMLYMLGKNNVEVNWPITIYGTSHAAMIPSHLETVFFIFVYVAAASKDMAPNTDGISLTPYGRRRDETNFFGNM